MTRRTRFHRPPRGPLFTRRDAKAWRRLVVEGRRALADPAAPGGDFAAAAERARSACMPWPVIKGQEPARAFVALVAFGLQWAAPPGRPAPPPAVGEALDEVERILGPEPPRRPPPPLPRRARADIDG